MLPRNTQFSLFERLRRPAALRVVFVLAAMLASQNSLACAFEAAFAGQSSELTAGVGGEKPLDEPAATPEAVGEDCCALCADCAHCGGCCSFAVTLRAGDTQLAFASVLRSKINFATSAPRHWTPPTPLRPPISPA